MVLELRGFDSDHIAKLLKKLGRDKASYFDGQHDGFYKSPVNA